jgi:hypothetical protein
MIMHERIEELPFLCNGEVNTYITIEELLGKAFSILSSPRLYNEDPLPTERERESVS